MKKIQPFLNFPGSLKLPKILSEHPGKKILLNLFEHSHLSSYPNFLKKNQPVLSARILPGSLKFSNWRIFSKHPRKYFLRNSLESPIFRGAEWEKK